MLLVGSLCYKMQQPGNQLEEKPIPGLEAEAKLNK